MELKLLNYAIKPAIAENGIHRPLVAAREIWKYSTNCHSKIDKTKILMTKGSFMKVESIAECSLGAFCQTFDLH